MSPTPSRPAAATTDPIAPRARGDGPVVALVPLRSPGEGKTRLSPALTVEQRAALAGAMLADVVTALLAAPVDRVVVAAGGGAAVSAGSALGVEVVVDPAGSDRRPVARRLDAAIASAAAQLGRVGALLVVAADLPHLAVADVTAVLACDAEVVVAPTVDGGTGGLLRRPPDACGTAYGAGSADRHAALAVAAGRRVRRLDLAGFAHDVDVAADLRTLRDVGRPPLGARTSTVLSRLGPIAETG